MLALTLLLQQLAKFLYLTACAAAVWALYIFWHDVAKLGTVWALVLTFFSIPLAPVAVLVVGFVAGMWLPLLIGGPAVVLAFLLVLLSMWAVGRVAESEAARSNVEPPV